MICPDCHGKGGHLPYEPGLFNVTCPTCQGNGVIHCCEGEQAQPGPASRKPWPSEAILIVAANWGEENRANMEAVIDAACRDCDRALALDTLCLREAINLPSRRERPIQFLCVHCATQNYDMQTITELHDHREVAP